MSGQNASSLATTRLEIINYELLKNRDFEEIQKLLQVSRDYGLFFLDLRGPFSARALSELEGIYEAQLNFFETLQESAKLEFSKGNSPGGYKQWGDVESFDIPRDEELKGTCELPDFLKSVESKLSSISSWSDYVTRDIFTALATSLNPPAPLTAGENPDEPGASLFQLGYSAASPGKLLVPPHSDSGLVTLLFYEEPSLEVLITENLERWALVEPIEGHHLVYIGDTLQKISENRLRAPLHRVTQTRKGAHLAVYLLHPRIDQMGTNYVWRWHGERTFKEKTTEACAI
ncbi:2og-fe oxygenase family protein [Penicillium lividum]|nr:2og-fe oxygenase family protein [Penicillium lividum]